MTNDELISKDFQIFIGLGTIYNTALLRTILENQSKIMQHLNIPNSSNTDLNKVFDDNFTKANELYKDKIPNYKDINPPLKD